MQPVMPEDVPRRAPYGVILLFVVALVVAGPLFVGDGFLEALTEYFSELLSPAGMLLLPVGLLLLIRLLSSDRMPALANVLTLGPGAPDSIHRLGGSPVGVALVLILILVLLYYRFSIFGGDGGDDE